MKLSRSVALATGLTITFGATLALAAEPVRLGATIRDHRFEPSELYAPAGVPIELTVRNEDGAAEELESSALKVEKIIAAGRQITVRLHALEPGRYEFVGEFHAETAKLALIVGAQ